MNRRAPGFGATYLMIPLVALFTFFAAAFPPWTVVHRASPESGILIAASFIGLIVLIARQAELEFAPLAAGALTLLMSGFVSRWLAKQTPVAAELIDLVIIHVVMLGILAAGDVVQKRRLASNVQYEREGTP